MALGMVGRKTISKISKMFRVLNNDKHHEKIKTRKEHGAGLVEFLMRTGETFFLIQTRNEEKETYTDFWGKTNLGRG